MPRADRAASAELLPNEVGAYELLRIQGGLRLEQERIPWDHSLATLGTELGGCDTPRVFCPGGTEERG